MNKEIIGLIKDIRNELEVRNYLQAKMLQIFMCKTEFMDNTNQDFRNNLQAHCAIIANDREKFIFNEKNKGDK